MRQFFRKKILLIVPKQEVGFSKNLGTLFTKKFTFSSEKYAILIKDSFHTDKLSTYFSDAKNCYFGEMLQEMNTELAKS